MTIDTNLIRRIEECSMNAWAAPRSMLLDGWVLRFANGYTKRANSVNVLYAGDRSIDEKIQTCQQHYAQQNLPLIFRLSPLASAELNHQLIALGLVQCDITSVQLKDLSQFDDVSIDPLQIWSKFSSEWLDCYAKISGLSIAEQQQLTAILTSIVPQTAFAVLFNAGEAIAAGLAILEETNVGLFEIQTHPNYRRQGHARSLILGLLSWATQQGAKTAYLQVVRDNQPALALYHQLGFTEIYQYFYRVQPSPSAKEST